MSRRKKIWLTIFGIAAVVAVVVAIVANRYARDLEPMARQRLVEYLESRFDASVELADLKISAAPNLHVVGRGLVIRHKRRTDIPPLIRLREFSFNTSWPEILAPVSHITLVRLDGLEIHTPPRRRANPPEAAQATRRPSAPMGKPSPVGDKNIPLKEQPSAQPPQPANTKGSAAPGSIIVDEIVADQAVLRMLPRDPEKPVKEFEMQELRIVGAGQGRPMTYYTKLKNYKPPGVINSRGQFGPWNANEPGQTPLAATYTFDDADLGVFKGIAGKLRSTGKFSGELNHIIVDGETDTPDFRLKMSGNPVPLKTKFHAIVDGTDGDTRLDPVEATLGRTKMLVRGAVLGEKDVKGKVINFDTVIQGGRLEDLLRLAVKGNPPLTGTASLKVDLRLPRGDEDVIEKLGLDGTFDITGVQFTSVAIQSKIDELARRGQGRPGDESVAQVPSRMAGTFRLADTVAQFSKLVYEVEGADVDVAGHYGIKSEEIDFDGVLRMDASMSRTFRGMKSLMLRPFDALFSRKDAGMVLSITITGTRENPKFGLDVKRTIKKADQ